MWVIHFVTIRNPSHCRRKLNRPGLAAKRHPSKSLNRQQQSKVPGFTVALDSTHTHVHPPLSAGIETWLPSTVATRTQPAVVCLPASTLKCKSKMATEGERQEIRGNDGRICGERSSALHLGHRVPRPRTHSALLPRVLSGIAVRNTRNKKQEKQRQPDLHIRVNASQETRQD